MDKINELETIIGKPPYKLNLGAGRTKIPGFISVDFEMPSTGEIDLIADARKLPFKDNSCTEIVSYHMIEHISRPDVIPMFKHWLRILSNGGKLSLELPNFDKIAESYLLGKKDLMVHMFGHQTSNGQYHFWGYSPDSLKEDLESVGFKNIKIMEATDYHVQDEPCFRVEAIKSSKNEFHLEPTNICTRQGNRCVYCSDKDTREKGFMDLRFAKYVLDQIKELNSDDKTIMLFLSGEPLLHPQIGELIMMANQVGKTVIHTNSDILDETKALQIINAGLKEIHLNLHYDPKTGKMPPKTLQNIKDFLILNDHQIETHVQRVVPFPEEIPNKEETLKEFTGADYIDFRRPHNWSKRSSIKGAEDITTDDAHTCAFLINNMAINWDGTIPVCCSDLNGEYIIGDAKNELIKDIDKKLDEIYSRQLNKEKILLCSECERYCPYKL